MTFITEDLFFVTQRVRIEIAKLNEDAKVPLFQPSAFMPY